MSKSIPYNFLLTSLIKTNLIWAVVAPIVLAFFTMIISNSAVFILKDAFFYFSFSLLFLLPNRFFNVKNKLRPIIFILLFLLFIILITFVFHDFHVWQVYNIRQLLAPIMIVSFVAYLKTNVEFTQKIIIYIINLVLWLIIIGGIFSVINIWNFFDLTNFFNSKGIPTYSDGTPAMFYEPAMNYCPRLVSTILDPISFGHIITSAIVSLYFLKSISIKRRKTYLFILLLGLILTFSKGAIFQMILCLTLLNSRSNIFFRILIPITVLVLGYFFIDLKGVIIHFKGLYFAFKNINWFGHGLGMVGNYAKMFATDLTIYKKMQISDTFIGSVIGQIGILGFCFWGLYFMRYFLDIFKKVLMPGSLIIVSQLIISILSENTLNFTSFFIPGILSVLVNKYRLYEYRNNRH